MLIILEGADGSGKTTLRQKFADMGYITKACVPHEQIDWQEIWNAADTLDIVLDRSWISDAVYRTVQRDVKPWDAPLQQVINLFDSNTVIVYCKTKTQYKDSMLRGEDNITDVGMAKKISTFYDDFLHFISVFTDAKVIKFDWQNDTFNELLMNIKGVRNNAV